MGIMSGLGKVKMFFKGKDGEMKEMEAETVEVTYEPVEQVENKYRELDFSNKEFTIEFESAEVDYSPIDNMITQLNEIIKNNKRDQKILNRTKNKRIAKKVYKRLYNL
jgi:ribosomal protein L24